MHHLNDSIYNNIIFDNDHKNVNNENFEKAQNIWFKHNYY